MNRNANANRYGYLRGLCVFLLLAAAVPFSSAANAKYASFVIEEETGRVLHARNPDTLRHPASLTKVMTLYMVFEALEDGRLKMDTRLKVSRKASRMPSSKLGLGRGETIRVRDAVLALAAKSANDVAVVVAEALAGTEQAFAEQMTKKARAIGMRNTTFKNASGLYHKRQKSTARDMARLAQRVRADFPSYYGVFSTKQFTYRGQKFRSHNKLLSRYQGTDGLKTGYIGAAGFNLVSTVSRHGVRLIGVVFGGRSSRSRDKHMIDLLNNAFAGYEALAIRPPRKSDQPSLGQVQIARAAPAPAQQPSPNPFLQQVNAALGNDPKPTPPALRAPARNGNWSVQVGAYRSKNRALQVAKSVKTRLGPIAEATEATVVPSRRTARPIFRSRLAGLSKPEAYKLCGTMKQQRMDCMVFAPVRGSQVAERRQ